MLALIVTIGMLNVCLGFGLAMYLGYGPPGLDGILQALGPMSAATLTATPTATPTETTDTPLPAATGLGALYIPGEDDVQQPAENSVAAAGQIDPAESFSEESVLSDVREFTEAAQAAMTSAATQSQQ